MPGYTGARVVDNPHAGPATPAGGGRPVLGALRRPAMIPRDYQRAAVDAAREKTGVHGNTMLVLPTGAGKTAIAGFYIGEEVEDTRDARVLVLQHTDELIEQNRGAIAQGDRPRHLGREGGAGRLGRAAWSSAASRRSPAPTGGRACRASRTW